MTSYLARIYLFKAALLVALLIILCVRGSWALAQSNKVHPAWVAAFQKIEFADKDPDIVALWTKGIEIATERLNQYNERRKSEYLVEFNDLDAEKHTCQVLSQLLGFESLVSFFSQSPEDYKYEGFENDWIYRESHPIISMRNWIVEAKRVFKMNSPEKINTWNLDCVARFLSSNPGYLLTFDPPKELWFRKDGDVLFATTPIKSGFAQELEAQLDRHPDIRFVSLGSGGGSFIDAMQAGILIRRRGVSTVLYNECYSACPLVFAGGIARMNYPPHPRFGFHQLRDRTGCALPFNDVAYELVLEYLSAMGIEPFEIIGLMISSSPNSMTFRKAIGTCRSGLSNYTEGFCMDDSLSVYTGQPVPKITRLPADSSLFVMPPGAGGLKPQKMETLEELLSRATNRREESFTNFVQHCISLDEDRMYNFTKRGSLEGEMNYGCQFARHELVNPNRACRQNRSVAERDKVPMAELFLPTGELVK